MGSKVAQNFNEEMVISALERNKTLEFLQLQVRVYLFDGVKDMDG